MINLKTIVFPHHKNHLIRSQRRY